MSEDRSLSNSTVTAIIRTPIEKVNIADWLFTLPDAEYQRCSRAHIAARIPTSVIHDLWDWLLQVESLRFDLVSGHHPSEFHNFLIESRANNYEPRGSMAS